jgi:tetratricopeptide (TPR) repeat protein
VDLQPQLQTANCQPPTRNPEMIVGQTKRFSSRLPTSVLAAGILIVCGWISPVGGAGPDLSKEGFPKATPALSAKNSNGGNSAGQTNYGGMVVVGIIAVLTAIVGASIWRSHELAVRRNLAIEAENQAATARKSAEYIINHLLDQLRDRLEPLGHLDIVEDVQRMLETYYEKFGFSEQDPEGLNRWATLLQNQGDRLLAQGDMNGAQVKYGRSLEISRKLVTQDPENSAWLAALSVRYEKVGDLLLAQGDLNRARTQFRRLLEIQHNLARRNPGDLAWPRSLLATYEKLGDVLEAQGDLQGAEATYASSLQIMLKLVSQDPMNRARLRELSVIHGRLGGVLKAQGDMAGATRNFKASIEILTNLIREDGENPSLEWDLDWAKAQLREG